MSLENEQANRRNNGRKHILLNIWQANFTKVTVKGRDACPALC